MKRVIVPLADGFEELEAVAIVDLLRRAGMEVALAGVDGVVATGSRGVRIVCDTAIESVDASGVDAVVLPGGMPGAANLGKSAAVLRLLHAMARDGRLIGAICAAPTILNRAGLLDGRLATSHPAHEGEMDRCRYSRERVVVDGNVVTSRGAGTAIEFAAELVKQLAGAEVAQDILLRIVHR
jgi:4-methyl-5(b-hydroxyethyl)-thiazole monophosphate biosynthesis